MKDEVNFFVWSISDYAAWWGAIIATLMLALKIVSTLRSGPRIFVQAAPNIQIFPQDPDTKDQVFIAVTVVNRGDAPTTLTHFCGFHTASLWGLIRKKKRQYFVIPTYTSLGDAVPHVLAPGAEWRSKINQPDVQKKFESGYLYVGVIHNQRKRPVYVRVKINN